MTDLLHFALEHSDPTRLKEAVEEARRGQAGDDALAARRAAVREALDALDAAPTEAEAIAAAGQALAKALAEAGDGEAAAVAALEDLAELAGPLDNAADLDKLGALAPVVEALSSPSREVAVAAAGTLGAASANLVAVQAAATELGAVEALLRLLTREGATAATRLKALYALSALTRNGGAGREELIARGGRDALARVLGDDGEETRVRKRALTLASDLARGDAEGGGQPLAWEEALARGATALLRPGGDADAQEKALLALEALAGAPESHAALRAAGAPAAARSLAADLASSIDPDDDFAADVADLAARVADALEAQPAGRDGGGEL